ncbi:MAG: membrane protein insertase YidC [Pyrinomonadaceae bacterium]
MEDQNKQQTQSRFLIAAVLSMVVIGGWSYFFAPSKPANDANANVTTNSNIAQSESNANSNLNSDTNSATGENAGTEKPVAEAAVQVDDVPNKTITIKSPLYSVKLDSKGAVATSWVLLLNDSTSADDRKPLYAQGSTKTKKIPLELISAEGLKRNQAPFRLLTGDADFDNLVNSRNYQVADSESEVELKGNETKKIDFVLSAGDGTEVVKSYTFRADSYLNDIAVTIKKQGKTIPNAKLVIGPSIGDQGIEHYTFYKVEPEGLGLVNDGRERKYAASIVDENTGKGASSVPGEIDWAGIGDTYFAMLAVPSAKTQGLEYTSESFQVKTEPFYSGIIAWITRKKTDTITKHLMTAQVPIVADGKVTTVYTGTKDYFVLTDYNKTLSEHVGRPIDIEDTINYGYLRFITKPLSVPILYCLTFIYDFTHNYGISIILFTLLFYSLLFPLRWFSSKSFKKSQKNAPKMKELQDKLKALQKKGVPMDDPEMRKLQMEQLKMTKDALPIGGCLPMILQFPLLIAIYITVSVYLGFRQESFLWLPDLSSGDPKHILEFAFAISMGLQMKFSPTTPTVTPEQQMQQKLMTYLMPFMMLWVMWGAPSGLLLYWFTGNIFMFGQQLFINWLNREPAVTSPETA